MDRKDVGLIPGEGGGFPFIDSTSSTALRPTQSPI